MFAFCRYILPLELDEFYSALVCSEFGFIVTGKGSCSCSNNAVHSGEKNGRICVCVAPESGSPGSANEAGGGRAGPAVVWDSSAWDHWDDLEHHEHAVIGAAQCQLFWGHHCHVLCVR